MTSFTKNDYGQHSIISIIVILTNEVQINLQEIYITGLIQLIVNALLGKNIMV